MQLIRQNMRFIVDEGGSKTVELTYGDSGRFPPHDGEPAGSAVWQIARSAILGWHGGRCRGGSDMCRGALLGHQMCLVGLPMSCGRGDRPDGIISICAHLGWADLFF